MAKSTMIFRMLFVLLLSCLTYESYAQSGDKLFMEGQQMQQNMTIASQNAAIKKFQAAKVVYTTADKKKMCDNQITICNRNIASLKRNGNKKVTPKVTAPVETKKLSLSQNLVEFDGGQAGAVNVSVDATSMDWVFTVPEGVEGTNTFIKVTRSSDAKSIDIAVEANPSTLDREQIINVDFGDDRQIIKVRQGGKPVTLSTNTNMLKFKLKGGSKDLEIYTNSDSIIAANNDQTWYVESKPDWVETSVKVKKKKGFFNKAFSAIKETVAGSASAASAEDVKISNVEVVVLPIDKTSPEYGTGRKGEIVFASQDKRYRITVVQQK